MRIDPPSLEPRRVAIATLEPGATPTPSPVPTPTPIPAPTPTPVPAPRGATLRSAGGTQQGAPNSFCWTGARGGVPECSEHPAPFQASALPVAHGETVLIVLDAGLPPSEESIRPFKGSRSNYPSQRIDPALETELTVDLAVGPWDMDLCVTWYGHGETICWLFRLDVV